MAPPESVESRIINTIRRAANELHYLAERKGLVTATPAEILRDRTWEFRTALLEDFPENGYSLKEQAWIDRIKAAAEFYKGEKRDATFFTSRQFPFIDLEANEAAHRYSVSFYDPRILKFPLEGAFPIIHAEGIKVNQSGISLWVKTRSYPLPTRIDLKTDPKNDTRHNVLDARQPDRVRFITQFAYWATDPKNYNVSK